MAIADAIIMDRELMIKQAKVYSFIEKVDNAIFSVGEAKLYYQLIHNFLESHQLEDGSKKQITDIMNTLREKINSGIIYFKDEYQGLIFRDKVKKAISEITQITGIEKYNELENAMIIAFLKENISESNIEETLEIIEKVESNSNMGIHKSRLASKIFFLISGIVDALLEKASDYKQDADYLKKYYALSCEGTALMVLLM